ncbi:MAG: hypothetical protein KAR39_04445 [Thermoplasmata archaeon]|nr:hypothetical protein [Thermoplasmata archaeon]
MKSCCVQAGERFFASNYPWAMPIEQESLTAHLLNLCKKWGKITSPFAENFYVRSTSSLQLGVDAKTGSLKCDACGDIFDFIFIGNRLFFFIWRINWICATYWDTQDESEGNQLSFVSGSFDWPRNEHLEQVRTAFDMYFGDDPFLGPEGLTELNRQISELILAPAIIHDYIIDFAELFVLFHEIQHQIPMSQMGPKPSGVSVQLPNNLGCSSRRANWWIAELTHDANSLYLLLLSAVSVFLDKFGMTPNDAKTQAASLVCTGADAALHTLQSLEELRYGKIDLEAAATSSEFVRHPPSDFRRNALSLASYSLVTGKSTASLLRREFTDSWKTVAQNVASHMQVRDRLFRGYDIWRQTEG